MIDIYFPKEHYHLNSELLNIQSLLRTPFLSEIPFLSAFRSSHYQTDNEIPYQAFVEQLCAGGDRVLRQSKQAGNLLDCIS